MAVRGLVALGVAALTLVMVGAAIAVAQFALTRLVLIVIEGR